MHRSSLNGRIAAVLAAATFLTLVSTSALGAPTEPTPKTSSDVAYWVVGNSAEDVYYNDLPADYVRTWYIYSDLNSIQGTNGILDPGDTYVASFKNWWTTESANTEYNYRNRGEADSTQLSGAPMNPVYDDASKNFWLSTTENTLSFYLTYSQFDNAQWNSYTAPTGANYYEQKKEELALRNTYANGWALGWIVDDYDRSTQDGQVAGSVKMDVTIHNGKSNTPDTSSPTVAGLNSNPAVATSDDISIKALDKFGADMVNGQIQPPNYTGADGADIGYDWSINEKRFTHPNNGKTEADFNEVVNSMEFYETNPMNPTDPAGAASVDMIYANRTPSQIASTLTDGNGNSYLYQDAFLARNANDRTQGTIYTNGTTDGGVLKGLGGYSYYDTNDPNKVNDWGEQQVIRIDIDTSTFAEGNVERLIIWDFGNSTPGADGTQQTDPIPLVLFVDLTQTVAYGQIFYSAYDANGDPIGPRIYFPENRIYIATVGVVPEPVTMAMLAVGGMTLLLRRKNRS